MTTRPLQIFIILAFTSCGRADKLPDNFKAGLVGFDISVSKVTQQVAKGETLEFGALWTGFNKINASKIQDTLILEVKEFLNSTDYDGGFELQRDTLFLYAKQLDGKSPADKIHATLTYKILSKDLAYQEIAFRETNQ